MFENILTGRYIDTVSPIHRINALTKLIMMVTLTAVIFSLKKITSLLYIAAFVIALIRLSGLKIKILLKNTKYIIFFAFFTFIFNLFLTDGETIFKFFSITATAEGLFNGSLYAMRLIVLVWISVIFMLTTRPTDITDAVELLLSPLSRLHIPVSDISVIIGLTLRFIPLLGEEAQKITDAQKSRCADFDGSSIIQKAKAVLPLTVPLLESTFRRSEALAEAMASRCYGMHSRTKMLRQKAGIIDLYAAIIFTVAIIIPIGAELI